MKKLLALLLALLLLTSCGAKNETQKNAPNSANAETSSNEAVADITQPVVESYEPLIEHWTNPLKVSVHNEQTLLNEEAVNNETDEHEYWEYISFLTISGLKDKEIEKSINGDLIDQLNKGCQWKVPAFANLKDVKAEKLRGGRDFYLSEMWNSNDYLSIHGSSSITDEENGNRSYGDSMSSTYDLKTGKKLALKDLFAKDYDYASVINACILEELKEYDPDREIDEDYGYEEAFATTIKQTVPFKGIVPEQEFYLTEYGLVIVLNYLNSELEFDGYYLNPISVSVSYSLFGDKINLSRKSDAALYDGTQKASHRNLIGSLGGRSISTKESKYEGDLNIAYSIDSYYPEAFPQELKDIAQKMIDEKLVDVKPYIEKQESLPEGESLYHSIYYNAYGSITGKYYNCSVSYSIPDVDNPDKSEYFCKYLNFDENLKQMELKDIFDANFDYESFLEQEFEKTVEQTKQNGYEFENEVDCKAMAQNAQFCIYNDCVYFTSSDSVYVNSIDYDYGYNFSPYCWVYYGDENSVVLNY